MFKRFTEFLGPTRTQALFLLIASTGLISLVLNSVQGEAIPTIQSLLALIAVVGAGLIIFPRFDREERLRWLAIITPAVVALYIGVFWVPSLSLVFFGAALGWIVAGLLVFRTRGPVQYRAAVKHLRKNNYEAAIKEMDALIKAEPKTAQHYHFRAQILRVWGKLDRAKRDYRTFIELAPESAKAIGYNSLSEVLIQTRDYPGALEAAQAAYDRAPDQWEALYNLAIVEDRLQRSTDVITHLIAALSQPVKDTRHRLLMHFYLARAYSRLGDLPAAQDQIAILKKHRGALKEWKTLLDSDQADTLRAVLGEDVNQARALIEETMSAAELGQAR